MNTFSYSAVDAQGNCARGTIEALDWAAAQSFLSARGFRSIVQASSSPEMIAEESFPSLNQRDATELARYMSELSKTGLPLSGALRALAADQGSGQLRAACEALATRLETGQSLEAALESVGTRLPAHIRIVMVVAARSGDLPAVLDQVLAYERDMNDLTGQFYQALAYPLVLGGFLIAWLLFATMWLVPQTRLDSLLADFGTQPTGRVNGLLEFSRVAPPIILGTALATVLVVGLARVFGGVRLVSRMVGQLPMLGLAWSSRGMVEFTALLGLFLRQQAPLPEALRFVSLSARDPAIRFASGQVAQQVEGGHPLSESIALNSIFPPTLVNLIAWGESHSALVDSLASARQMFHDRFQLQTQLTRFILPPIVFVLTAGSILFMVYGIFGYLIKLVTDLS